MLGNPHVRFDERDVEPGAMVGPLRHRQTKGAATDMPGLPPPRHIPTLPNSAVLTEPSPARSRGVYRGPRLARQGAKVYLSCTARRRKPPSSVANRNPPK